MKTNSIIKSKEKKCNFCQKKFTPKRSNGLYCSNTCKQYFYNYRCQLKNKDERPYHVLEYKKIFIPAYVRQNFSKKLYHNYAKTDAELHSQFIEELQQSFAKLDAVKK